MRPGARYDGVMLRVEGVVAVFAAGVLSAAALACGVASESANAFAGGDSGGEGDGGGEDSTIGDSGVGSFDASGGTDSSTGADGGMVQTGAEFVHASPDLPDLRLCWKVNGGSFGNAVPYPSGAPAPASNYPALPIGGAVALPDASGLVGSNLTIVGIPAGALAALEANQSPPPGCSTLLTPGVAGTIVNVIDYDTFTLPAGIVAGATDILALAGCPANDPLGSVARCGAGYTSATGNLHVDVLPLYQVTQSDAGQLPVQTAQLSPALAQLAGDGGAVVVSFGPQGAPSPVATLGAEGAFAPASAAYLNVGTNPTSYGTLGFGVDVVGADGGPGHLWMSLEQSLELFDPMMNPAIYYAQVDTYVVAVVGDPNSAHAFTPDASFDGTGLHVLVFPL
jgi:hypothetical protein